MLSSVLYDACKGGDLLEVKRLVKGGHDPTAGKDLLLRAASHYGHLGIVKYLVSVGANISADGDVPVALAAITGRLEIVKYLVSHGAIVSGHDNYAIRYAHIDGHPNVVKYIKNLVLKERKKRTLLWLLYKKRIIHRDLVSVIPIRKYKDDYGYYSYYFELEK